MPELGPYGSVRGARGNSRPYRDRGATPVIHDPMRTFREPTCRAEQFWLKCVILYVQENDPIRRVAYATPRSTSVARRCGRCHSLFGRRHTPPKMARLGTLSPTLPLDEKSLGGMILLKTLQQRGYTLGKNLTFEARATNGQVAKLGEAARNMKAEQIDAVVVIGFPTVLACKVANVPTVVAFGCGDPVATHLIDRWRVPEGWLPAFPMTPPRFRPSVSR